MDLVEQQRKYDLSANGRTVAMRIAEGHIVWSGRADHRVKEVSSRPTCGAPTCGRETAYRSLGTRAAQRVASQDSR
jgi:hypothetical protein